MSAKKRGQRHLGEQGDGDFYVARAAGSYLYDTRGKRYVDFVMGWCVGEFGSKLTLSMVGLAIGLHFDDDNYADKLTDRCRRNGLLVAGQSGGMLLLPALNMDRRTASRGLNILEQSV